MNTNWSSPKTNVFAGVASLRSALAAGMNAKLIRARNEDCAYPIKVKRHDNDFRNYEFQSGHLSSRNEILSDNDMDDMHKRLSLNYKTCYGKPEAVKRYYEAGLLSADNFKGMGTSHLVSIKDLITYYKSIGNLELAELFRSQYHDDSTGDEPHWYDFYRYKHGSQFVAKRFKRKLWVVVLLNKKNPKVSIPWYIKTLNTLMYPLKYVPKRSVLRMKEYKLITYRVGGVTSGFSVEFHVPKKFGFK